MTLRTGLGHRPTQFSAHDNFSSRRASKKAQPSFACRGNLSLDMRCCGLEDLMQSLLTLSQLLRFFLSCRFALLGSTPEPVKHIVTSPNTIKGKNILCTCLQLFRAGSRQLSAKRASRWTYHVYIKGSWQQVHSAVNSLRLIQP